MVRKRYTVSFRDAQNAFNTLRTYCNERKVDGKYPCDNCKFFKTGHCYGFDKLEEYKESKKNTVDVPEVGRIHKALIGLN